MRPRVLVVFVVLVLGLGPEARAEPADLRKAREHYRQGKEAYAADRFDEAYREFQAGYHLSGRPLFLLNMGHARRRAGDLPAARAHYQQFLSLQPDSPYRLEVETILRQIAEPGAAASPAPPTAPPPAVPLPPPLAAAAPPPLLVRPDPPAPPPAPRTRWWLWAGAGGAVVAAVMVGVLATSGRDSYTRQGSLGTLGAP